MARTKKDAAVVDYVLAHPDMGDRSAQVVAKRLGMDEMELRALVHVSTRVRMRAVLLGWHVVELKEAEEHESHGTTQLVTAVGEGSAE